VTHSNWIETWLCHCRPQPRFQSSQSAEAAFSLCRCNFWGNIGYDIPHLKHWGDISPVPLPLTPMNAGPLQIYDQLTGYHQLLFDAFWLHPAVTLPRPYLQWHYERRLNAETAWNQFIWRWKLNCCYTVYTHNHRHVLRCNCQELLRQLVNFLSQHGRTSNDECKLAVFVLST